MLPAAAISRQHRSPVTAAAPTTASTTTADPSTPAPPSLALTLLDQADRATAAVNLEARYEISPHTLYDLLADPRQHDKIFDAILVSSSSSSNLTATAPTTQQQR